MLLTTGRLRDLASRETRLRKSTTAEILHDSAVSKRTSYDVFLSHSSMDSELVLGAKALMESYGFTVYVDWIDDPQLIRDRVNSTSAAVIRSRMRSCKMLVYAHTLNASRSKWCPWELGYFDGEKGGNIFILPVSKDGKSTFEGQEYLGLYPYIDEAESVAGKMQLWINYEEDNHRLSEALGKVFTPT